MAPLAREPCRESTAAGLPSDGSTLRRLRWGAFDLKDDLLRRRVKARATDVGLVLGPVAALQLALALFLLMVAKGFSRRPASFLDFSDVGAVFGSFYLTCVYVPMLPAAVVIVEVIVARKNGQTLGKRQTGVCVRHVVEDGVLSVASAGRLAARAAVLYVPPVVMATLTFGLLVNEVPGSLAVLGVIPVYVVVVVAPVLFSSHRRGLHDLVAGTVVVVVPAALANVQPSREPASALSATRSPRVRFSLRLAFQGLWKRPR